MIRWVFNNIMNPYKYMYRVHMYNLATIRWSRLLSNWEPSLCGNLSRGERLHSHLPVHKHYEVLVAYFTVHILYAEENVPSSISCLSLFISCRISLSISCLICSRSEAGILEAAEPPLVAAETEFCAVKAFKEPFLKRRPNVIWPPNRNLDSKQDELTQWWPKHVKKI